MIAVDYMKLARAQEYYTSLDYKLIDAPWWISNNVVGYTTPAGCRSFQLPHKDKVLVASGEQSFLYLAAKGHLPDGKYLTITPCFRDEQQDDLHRKNFMKAELIDTETFTEARLEEIIEEALGFFSKYIDRRYLDVVKEPAHLASVNFDITAAGIELGSYGMRSCRFLNWIYATGCAEPRLSAVMSHIEVQKK